MALCLDFHFRPGWMTYLLFSIVNGIEGDTTKPSIRVSYRFPPLARIPTNVPETLVPNRNMPTLSQ
jgi:hypothetical protein